MIGSTEGKQMKIFGKEPAYVVGVIEAVVVVLVTFGLPQDVAVVITTIVVAVGGVLTAIAAKDTLLAAMVGLVKAIAVLVVFLGYHWSDANTAAIIGVITIVASGWLRTQTSSTDTPLLSSASNEIPAGAILGRGARQADVVDPRRLS
jgi:hypothetical protein